MKTLIFGTTNAHKLKEIKGMMPDLINLKSMQEIGITKELPEEQDTIEGNAAQKANELYELCETNCFAEDTGLVVDALNGEPGVHSARYAGPEKDAQKNMRHLLDKLQGIKNRSAHFLTIIALHWDGGFFTFEGRVNGRIAAEPMGEGGFGYDPIFIPEGYERSFGILPAHVKNQISHRARAVNKLIDFLKQRV
jgi:XTP/dITP diphosphohydrolase